jgi:RecB family endonuclease NucS
MSLEILHKFTCIELKSDRATKQDLRQVLRYEDWLSRKLAAGDNEMIQSILVARRFADSVIAYVKNYLRIEEKTVRLITYNVSYDNQDIELQEECFIP